MRPSHISSQQPKSDITKPTAGSAVYDGFGRDGHHAETVQLPQEWYTGAWSRAACLGVCRFGAAVLRGRGSEGIVPGESILHPLRQTEIT